MDILSILRSQDMGPDIWRFPNVQGVDGIAVYKAPPLSGMTRTLLMVATEYARAGHKTVFDAYEDKLEALRNKARMGGFAESLDHPNLDIIPGDSTYAWSGNVRNTVFIFDTARVRWPSLASMVMGTKAFRDQGALVICGWQTARSGSK